MWAEDSWQEERLVRDYSRRALLVLIGRTAISGAILPTFVSRLCAASGTTVPSDIKNPKLFERLILNAAASELAQKQDTNASAKTLLSTAAIVHEKPVFITLIDPSKVDLDALSGWDSLLKKATPSAAAIGENVSTYVASGIQTLGAVAAIIPGLRGVGLGLGIAGIWADSTLRYLSQPGLELAYSPFPLPTPEDTRLLFSDALLCKEDACELDSQTAYYADNSVTNSKLRLTHNADLGRVTAALPQEIQASVRAALVTGSSPETDMQAFLKARVDAVDKKVSDLGTTIKGLVDPTARLAEAQKRIADINYTVSEFRGAAQVVGFFPSDVVGGHAASKINQGVALAVQVATMIASCYTGVGTLAVAGQMTSVIAGFQNLLSGQPSTDQIIISYLKNIEESISDLRKFVQLRFSDVIAKEDFILLKLEDLAHLIAVGTASVQNSVEEVHQLLMENMIEQDKNLRVSSEAAFERAVSACVQHLQIGVRDQVWANNYGALLNRIKDHGVLTAREPYYTRGDQDAVNVNYAAQSIRSDLFFAWAVRSCSTIGKEYQSRYATLPNQAQIPNPLAWARAVQTYLGLLAQVGKTRIPGKDRHLSELWSDGIRIREAILTLTSASFQNNLLITYSVNCGGALVRVATSQDPMATLATIDHNEPASGQVISVAPTGTPNVSVGTEKDSSSEKSVVSVILQEFEKFAAARQIQRPRSVAVFDVEQAMSSWATPITYPPVPTKGRSYVKLWGSDNAGRVRGVTPAYTVSHVRYTTLDPDPIDILVSRGYFVWQSKAILGLYDELSFGPRYPASDKKLPNDITIGISAVGPTPNTLRDVARLKGINALAFDDAEAQRLFDAQNAAWNQIMDLCNKLLCESDADLVRKEFPGYLDTVFSDVAFRDSLNRWYTTNMVARVSQGIYVWKSLGREAAKRMSYNVAENTNTPILGAMQPLVGVSTPDQLKNFMKVLIAAAPASPFVKQSAASAPPITPDFKWSQFFKDNLDKAFSETARLLFNGLPNPNNGRSVDLVDDTLRQLAGYASLAAVGLPAI
jgi:hypothetical protein